MVKMLFMRKGQNGKCNARNFLTVFLRLEF